MAYLPHCRVIIQGVLGTSSAAPSESFQTGFQISDTNFADLPSQTQVDNIASLFRTQWAASDFNLSSNAWLTAFTVVAIDSAGKWRKNPDGSFMKRVATLSPASTGGYATATREYPTSSVVSLMTVRAGAHGRGRMYLPLPAEAPDITGHVTAATCTNRATAMATFFHNANTQLATGAYMGVVVVASKAGFLTPVTKVRVGDVHDVQRRRRDHLTETYQVATV